jgi:predicted lipoprotein with Yx(FWY)xxD motif
MQVGGCASNDGGIDNEEGGSDSGGSAPTGGHIDTGGQRPTGGTSPSSGGKDGPLGGEAGSTSEGGVGASTTGGSSGGVINTDGGKATGGTENTGGVGGAEGGATGGSDGGMGAEGGSGATDGGKTKCVYFTKGEEVIDSDGAGGASPKPTITVRNNSFAGPYLADGAGKALYTYGADAPGECSYTPLTNCFVDCAISWPPFNGEPRLLAPGLDDSMFGTIERIDGTTTSLQTTYMGWPLYYYKNDTAPADAKAVGDVKGHAVGKIWTLATVTPPNIVLLRINTVRTLADELGHVLYTSGADTPGTKTKAPISACTGACLKDFEPFVLTYLAPISYVVASDFSYFVRSDGKPQIAYKGLPLYLSHADERSAQTNGTAFEGWVVAAP